MKIKLKVLSYYFSMIFLSVMVLLLSLTILAKHTIFNEKYIISHLEKNNYYDKLCVSIKEEMSYYIIQSGLVNEVLDNIYTKEMVKTSLNSLINDFYSGKELVIETKIVSDNLNKNIQNYLLKNNIIATDQKALDLFVDQMINIYDKEIRVSNAIVRLQSLFIKLDKLIDIMFIVFLVAIPLFGIFCHFFYKRIVYTMPTISSAVLLLLGEWLLYNRIDVKNILFWNDNVSSIIKSVLWNISKIIKIEAIILIILGCVAFIIGYILTNSCFKKKSKDEIIIKNNDGSYREFSSDGYRVYSEAKVKKEISINKNNVNVNNSNNKANTNNKFLIYVKKVLIYIKKLLIKLIKLLKKKISVLFNKFDKKEEKIISKEISNFVIKNDDNSKIEINRTDNNKIEIKTTKDKSYNNTYRNNNNNRHRSNNKNRYNTSNSKNINNNNHNNYNDNNSYDNSVNNSYDNSVNNTYNQIIMDDYKIKKKRLKNNKPKSEYEINYNKKFRENDMVDELFGFTYGTYTTERRKKNRYFNKNKYNGNNNYRNKHYYKNNYNNKNRKYRDKDFNNTNKQDTK